MEDPKTQPVITPQTADEPPKVKLPRQKRSLKKLLVLLLVLLLMAAAGGAVWWWRGQEMSQALTGKHSEIESLKAQLSQAEEEKREAETEPDTVATGPSLPIVVFAPGGLFSDEEKTTLTSRLVSPMKDYYLDNAESDLVSILIERKDTAGYKYVVNAIHGEGQHQGFLFGKSEPLEWWKPECLDGCSFSDSYKAKYPDVVQ